MDGVNGDWEGLSIRRFLLCIYTEVLMVARSKIKVPFEHKRFDFFMTENQKCIH
jgi:hypothetical protein